MKYEIYAVAGGEYCWRQVARGGRVIANSPKSYARPTDAARAAKRAWELNQSFGFEVSYG